MEIEDSARVLQDNQNQTLPRQPLKDDRWEQFCLAVTYWIDHEDCEHTGKANDENDSSGKWIDLHACDEKLFRTCPIGLFSFFCLQDFHSGVQSENVAPLYHLQPSRAKKDLHGMEVMDKASFHVDLL